MQATLFELEAPLERSIVPTLHNIDYFTDAELCAARGTRLLFDVECYPNYFLVAFKCFQTGKVLTFELSPDHPALHLEKLAWVLENFTLVGFNSRAYDMPLVALAFRAPSAAVLKHASDTLTSGIRLKEFLDEYGLAVGKYDHIDLISVAPLEGSLKLYAGRLHCPRMQDLPYDHTQPLTQEQANILKHYCINDLDNTKLLLDELTPQIELREQMGNEYEQDLRSLSDAQVAERVICSEVKRLSGKWPKRPEKLPTHVRYTAPSFLKFQSPELREVLKLVQDARFDIDKNGSPVMPPELEGKVVTIGAGNYRMGIGGLHSSEECSAFRTDEYTLLIDRDVASYYPSIILNQELYPRHMGTAFLEVYSGIVRRRLEAKKVEDTVTAESLKITINGSFGKFGSMWSALYSPDLMLQVTLTGQLSLLMLIEAIESANIIEIDGDITRRCKVVSANTDGIVTLCPKSAYDTLQEIFSEWEMTTGFQTEETRYAGLWSRDVNNYIGLKYKYDKGKKIWLDEIDGVKTKGAYAHPWAKAGRNVFKLHKNPQNLICIEAVTAFLKDGTPLDRTIGQCKDLTRFLSVRNVRGGAHKDGAFLGKTVRWYYSVDEQGPLRYITSGNQVPRSKGARPLMDLPAEFPTDLNYSWYIAEAISQLIDLGYWTREAACMGLKDVAVLRLLKTRL